jgi:molecular chaperone HscB
VLDEPIGATHFQRLAVPASEDVDQDVVETQYLRLSRLLHPDFRARESESIQQQVLQNSARLNEALSTLTDDQRRAEYVLGLLDPDALEQHKQLDPAFLMETMDISEGLEDCGAETTARIAGDVANQITERMNEVTAQAARPEPDTARLAVLLHEVRVLRRILRDTEST